MSHDCACPGTLPNGELCTGEHGDCPGRGRCHGCMMWCERCADVDGTCDSFECMVHRCYDCHNVLTYGDREFNAEHSREIFKWCLTCWVRAGVEYARESNPTDEIRALETLSRAVERYRAMDAHNS